jgi:thiamine biosynthesis lipoprotein
VSVAASTCAVANAAATAAIVKGRAAVAWLDSRGLPARLVDRHGGVLVCGGWPSEGTGTAA